MHNPLWLATEPASDPGTADPCCHVPAGSPPAWFASPVLGWLKRGEAATATSARSLVLQAPSAEAPTPQLAMCCRGQTGVALVRNGRCYERGRRRCVHRSRAHNYSMKYPVSDTGVD